MLPLDGLRGLASLSVIVCHMWPSTYGHRSLPFRALQAIIWFGWSGVDLFFVLSGFLITGILLRSKSAPPARYFGVFYARRFLRVFPIYYLMLAIFLVVVPRLAFFSRVNDFWIVRGSAWPYWAYLCNWTHLGTGTHVILCVCWSLAIEEQYYVIWPLTARLATPRQLGGISLTLFASSAVLRLTLLASGTAAADLYRMTFTHLDGIALGSALAVAHTDPERWGKVLARYARALPILGLMLLAVVMRAAAQATPQVEPAYQPITVATYWLVALFYGSLLIASLGDGRLRIAFSNPFLRRLGRYSYAAYLFQFVAAFLTNLTLRHIARHFGVPDPDSALFRYVQMLLSVALSYGLAACSWIVLEGPLNAYKDRARALRLRPQLNDQATPHTAQALRSGGVAVPEEPGVAGG